MYLLKRSMLSQASFSLKDCCWPVLCQICFFLAFRPVKKGDIHARAIRNEDAPPKSNCRFLNLAWSITDRDGTTVNNGKLRSSGESTLRQSTDLIIPIWQLTLDSPSWCKSGCLLRMAYQNAGSVAQAKVTMNG